eukprot:g63827.t1
MKRSREENNDFSSQYKELTKLIESASRSSDSSRETSQKQMKQESANQMVYRAYLGEEKKKGLSAFSSLEFNFMFGSAIVKGEWGALSNQQKEKYIQIRKEKLAEKQDKSAKKETVCRNDCFFKHFHLFCNSITFH